MAAVAAPISTPAEQEQYFPPTPFPGKAKQYEVVTTNTTRTKAAVTLPSSPAPVFEFDFGWGIKDLKNSRKKHSVVLRSGNGAIVGVGDIDLKSIGSPVHICLGDPDAPNSNVAWEGLPVTQKLKTNNLELSIDLGEGIGRKVFYWRRTRKGDGIGSVAKKLDWLNLKLVEKDTERQVARFVHNPWFGTKRGMFEIASDDAGAYGQQWETVVLLSGMTVIEYLRKATGWSL